MATSQSLIIANMQDGAIPSMIGGHLTVLIHPSPVRKLLTIIQVNPLLSATLSVGTLLFTVAEPTAVSRAT